jgi:hypothetical protein
MKQSGLTMPVVSDHAVLRYIERKHDIDVEAIRAHIRDAVASGVRLGASGVIAEGVKFVLVDENVVTCLKKNWHSRDLRKGAER